MTLGLDELVATQFETRNFPESPLSVTEIRSAEFMLQDLWFPTLVAKESALLHNLERFASWCREQGVLLAPHGKTTMSPQLWQRQLTAGAWGITAATVAQARVMDRFGVERVIVANEVVAPDQARWLAGVNLTYGRDYYVLVDSHFGIRTMEYAAAGLGATVPVLIEFGVGRGRTGARTMDEAMALSRAVAESPHLQLTGVEGYEGALPQGRGPDAVEGATEWLATLSNVVSEMDRLGFFDDADAIIATAGGSGFPDLAAHALARISGTSRRVEPIIRSGAYITHDHLTYERRSPLRSTATDDPLIPALTCYAQVISTPEPGTVLVGAGKRDVPYDEDLPTVLNVRRADCAPWRPQAAEVIALNDHHLYIHDRESTLAVGDLLELGLSHPCTTFDKWQMVPVVDDQDGVIDGLVTLF